MVLLWQDRSHYPETPLPCSGNYKKRFRWLIQDLNLGHYSSSQLS